ncbi:HAMP domain-containing sensor histidine kinase [Flavobacterium sp. 5]|uniref:sensor histidine kinase n=1 Tax=Flavobacterium sp. 5 TaxID=2035199 RepID=UPI000C2C4631|nr:HAMP domain-containing sensor histidine kinase [Flavobacterium sp. 5]PKB18742.1 signal transduction histidine kinase [Flavobacterium sp. 5]
MEGIKAFRYFKKTNIIILLILIFVSCSALIFINCFTIKILSGSRAYVNGESHYSKGQKDAVRHLITYLYTDNIEQWKLYENELSVPQGDGTARIALIKNLNTDIIKKGFRNGRNHEKDLDDLIWVFKNFKAIPFMRKAINEWRQGDILISQIDSIGDEIHKEIINGHLTVTSRNYFLTKLSDVSDKLTINERNFSNTLGEGTREIRDYLIYTNIFFVLIIFGSVSLYYNTMIKRLLFSKNEINESNKYLQTMITDLENIKTDLSKEIIQQKKIIGTISHDIKSPLKYIVLIGKYLCEETKKTNNSVSHKYATSILKSSSQLYEFTNVLVEYSDIYIEEKRYEIVAYPFYDLVHKKIELFTEIAHNNNSVIFNKVDKNLISHVNNRIVAIILHNLLDNAIKNTIFGEIEVGAFADKNKFVFWIKDTGIGMDQYLIDYYIDLFKSKESEKLILNNFGIGLHFVLELLIILKGNINFSSVVNAGTTVTVEIKY